MAKSTFTTHYDNLKVARNSPSEVIRAAYRALSQKYHPDKYHDQGEADRIMLLINEAYAVLSDPDRRRQHDEWITQQEAKAGEEERQAAERARQAETSQVPFDDAARFTNYPQSLSLGIPPKANTEGFLRKQLFSPLLLIVKTLIFIAIIVGVFIVAGVISSKVTEKPYAPSSPPLTAIPRPLPAANPASPAERILVASDARVVEIAKSVAETLAKDMPKQLDKNTKMISTVFVSSTKTFIYSYESTMMLDSTRMKPYIISKMCSDSNLHAFMVRGVMFRHQYAFPSGQSITSVDVRIKDC